jgi:hypothetical protein
VPCIISYSLYLPDRAIIYDICSVIGQDLSFTLKEVPQAQFQILVVIWFLAESMWIVTLDTGLGYVLDATSVCLNVLVQY